MHGPRKRPQASSESESITDKEDDVKVCDICGDAGQEDLLAICYRCTDGAEHTYCMQTMLDKLPDGDWLCEECKSKEKYENEKLLKFEMVTKIPEQSCLNEGGRNARSNIYSEGPLKNDGRVIQGDMVVSRTLKIPEIPFARNDENVDLNTVTCEKASKKSSSTETSVPQEIPLLFHEDSLTNPDYATKKPYNSEQSSGNLSIFKGQKAQTSSDPISSASRDGIKVIAGSILKSSSFKNTNTQPKVKQLHGAVPLTENTTGKFTSKNTRKDGLTREMVLSTSFITEKGGCNGSGSLNEKQSVNLTQIKDSSVESDKELSLIERQKSSALDFFQVEETRISRGLVDGDNPGYNRENLLHSSRGSISASSNGLKLQYQKRCQVPKEGFHSHVNTANKARKPDPVSQCNNHLSLESIHQDDLTKVATCSATSNKPISCGGRTLLCQKCNETGHPTHLCSIDKHSVSAINLSADRMSRENANRINKWKVARETIIAKQDALKCTNTTNQSKELPIPNFGYGAKVANRELPPHCFRRTCSQEGRTNATSSFVFDKSEPTVDLHASNQTEIHHEAGGNRLNPFGDIYKFNVKPSEQVLPSMDPCRSNTLRPSVIPVIDFFWQGGFEVRREGRLPECCDGLQAHFSSFASGKVFEAAKKLPPYKLELEEVPRLSSWPQHFHGNHANDNNVALFFFAKDMESYRSNYCKILENMLKYDLALKGNCGGFELLIFPSNKLSETSQRWNKLLFLWGTFKGRRSSSLQVPPNVKEDPCKSSMDAKSLVGDLPATLPEASNYLEASTATHMEATPASSANTSLCQTSVDAKLLPGNTCPLPMVHLPVTKRQVPSLYDSCPETIVQQKTA